jgi:hypothetical protein
MRSHGRGDSTNCKALLLAKTTGSHQQQAHSITLVQQVLCLTSKLCLCTCSLQVADLQAKLQAAVAEAEEINNQEKMFGWALTK